MPIEMPRGLPFAVDTWTPASSLKRHRFLTHAHRDHLAGITTTTITSIYASRLTILLTLRIFPDLDRASFVEIEPGAPPVRVADPDDGDFTVTAFDANHCPGAVMFLFEGAFGTVLHTGDCRLDDRSLLPLPSSTRRIDYVFLDCTFARCPLAFPTKDHSIRQVIDCIRSHPDAPAVYLACDMLGQEDVLVAVSRAFGGAKIRVDADANPDCHYTLSLLAPDILLSSSSSSDDAASSSRFRVIPFPRLSDRATEILAVARARGQPEPLIIRPSTQWYAHHESSSSSSSQERSRRPVLTTTEPVRDEFGVWHVCLSMHSSRDELERALGTLRPRWVVSTTPPCIATDLGYVRKHCCSLSRLGPDDPLWKLIGIPTTDQQGNGTTSSTTAAVTAAQTSTTLEAVDESTEMQVVTCCSAEEVEVAAEPTVLQGFDIGLEPQPAVTLFGSARFGLLQQNESQLWKDDYHYQCVDGVETEATEDSAIEPAASQSTCGKSDGKDEAEGERRLVQTSFSARRDQSELGGGVCNKDDDRLCVEAAELLLKDQHAEQGNTNRNSSKVMVAEKDDGTAPSSETTVIMGGGGSSERGHLNANLRRLYRSMHVPVPRPLPSLVELMAASSKRPRV